MGNSSSRPEEERRDARMINMQESMMKEQRIALEGNNIQNCSKAIYEPWKVENFGILTKIIQSIKSILFAQLFRPASITMYPNTGCKAHFWRLTRCVKKILK